MMSGVYESILYTIAPSRIPQPALAEPALYRRAGWLVPTSK